MFNLKSEKPARLEGALAENLFIKNLLSPSFEKISTGWWFEKQDESEKIKAIKFSHAPQLLVAEDFLVAERFASKNIFDGVDLVCPHQGGFGCVSFSKIDKQNIVESCNKQLESIPKKAGIKTENLTTTDLKRTERIIEYLKTNQLFEDVLMERYFASNFLNAISWDMDAYAIMGNDIIGFEVKQKYPMWGGKFGINVGLVHLFEKHEQHNIPVWHVILTKPVWNKSFSAVELLTNPKFSKFSSWIGARIHPTELKKTERKKSPRHTGLDNNSDREYHEISCTEFFHIKNFHDAPDDGLNVLLEGKCKEISSAKDIRRVFLT